MATNPYSVFPDALERTQAAASDPVDSFDDDLVWIVDRLVERVGGAFGLVVRRLADDEQTSIVARSTRANQIGPLLLETIARLAPVATPADRRRRDDADAIVQCELDLAPGTGRHESFRVLCLSFRPAQNVLLSAIVCRPNGARRFGPLAMHVAGRLYLVLQRYVRLWWMHRLERRRAKAFGMALDLADVAVLLLDRRGRTVYCNGRAQALLAREDGLRPHDHSIVATHPAAAARLQGAIQHAIHCNLSSAGPHEMPSGTPILTLSREGGRRALIVTVIAVESVAVDAEDPAVIVYVLDPDQNVHQLLSPICSLYKLTPAEARLVHHLVRGLTLAEAAQRMQVQHDTARAYLKQVFAKTETNRQADLVRVMLSSVVRTNATADLQLA